MKTVGQIIDEIERRIEGLTEKALNPDRSPVMRDTELHIRRHMVELLGFVTSDEKEPTEPERNP